MTRSLRLTFSDWTCCVEVLLGKLSHLVADFPLNAHKKSEDKYWKDLLIWTFFFNAVKGGRQMSKRLHDAEVDLVKWTLTEKEEYWVSNNSITDIKSSSCHVAALKAKDAVCVCVCVSLSRCWSWGVHGALPLSLLRKMLPTRLAETGTRKIQWCNTGSVPSVHKKEVF